MAKRFDNRVAVITGGGSGIGKAIAISFAKEGAKVVVVSIVESELNEVDKHIRELGGECLAVTADVTKESEVKHFVEAALEEFGTIDILVNNAGICPLVPWDQTTLKDWNRVLEVNLTGAFLCTKAVIPVMRRQKYGRIVYISSTAAAVGSLVAHVAYGASKAGVLALMKSVAKGFAADGIIANAVSPGTTDTPMTDSFGSAIKKSLVKNNVLRRRGNPEEIADAVLYLVSDRASYITGQNLKVDGGFALR